MTSATAATLPVEAEATQPGSPGPSGWAIAIHLAVIQIVWLAALAFAIYSVASG